MPSTIRIVQRVAELVGDWDQATFQDGYIPAWNVAAGKFQGQPALPLNGTPGQYGDSSHYPVITTDAQGRVVNVVLQPLPPVPAVLVSSVNDKAGDVVLNTGDIAEGVNLYFTDLRAAAAAPVQSVFGRAGNVSLQAGDIPAISSITQGGGTVSVAVDGALVLTPAAGKNATLSSGQLLMPNGTAALPALAFSTIPSMGFLANDIAYTSLARAGANVVTFDMTLGRVFAKSSGGFAWTNGDAYSGVADLFLYRDAANTLAQRNGVASQTYRLYNSYTDVSNNSYLEFTGTGIIRTVQNGTGIIQNILLRAGTSAALTLGANSTSSWQISVAGNAFQAVNDNVYDIGASGANRPRNLYLGGIVNAAGLQFGVTGVGGSAGTGIGLFSTQLTIGSNAQINFGSSTNYQIGSEFSLIRDAANTLAQRNGVNAQAFRVYNTYTDSSNGEWLESSWSTVANTCYIRTMQNGTGVSRNLIINAASITFGRTGVGNDWALNASGHWQANTDNVRDIGQSGANRPRNVYAATGFGNFTTPLYTFHALGGGARTQALITPTTPTVTPTGTAGSTTYTYYVVAKDQFGNKTLASPTGTIATGNATLSATDYNALSWTAVTGAVSYDVIRSAGGATQGSIALSTTALALNDIGQAASAYTTPTKNATADVIADGQVLLSDGTATSPGLAFASSISTGLRIVSGDIMFSRAGSGDAVRLGSTRLSLVGELGFGTTPSNPDLLVTRDAANTLAQRNGLNAQTFRVYNTYTDASNGEWLEAGWSGVIGTIQTKNNGTGVIRSLSLNSPVSVYLMQAGIPVAVFQSANINLRTYLQPNSNNAFDLGDATHSFRNLYLGSQALLSDGTQAAPSYAFANEPGMGMRRVGANSLSLTVNGSDVLNFSTASNFASMSNLTLIDTPATAYRLSPSQINAVQVASGKQLGWSSTTSSAGATDLALARDAPGTLAQRNGVNPQAFRIYNTFTDVSNGEWLETGWAGNVCTLATKANGTGVVRNLSFPGKVLAGGVDLGASQLNVYSGVGSSPVLQCQLNNVTDGTSILSVNNGGTPPFTVRGIYASLTSTSNAIFGIQQNGTGNAVMDVLMVGTVGDGFFRCGLNGGAAWSAGIKQSDGSFRIAPGNSFATAAVLTLTTTTATFAANVLVANGTVATPGLAFSSETGLGFYRPGAQTIGLVGAGSEFLRLDTASVVIAANNILAWGSNGIAGIDTVLRRDAGNTLAQRNGVNPQTFRLYSTYTDASNYELATFGYDASNVRFQIATKKAGTGINRPLALISDANVYIITSGGVGWFCTNSGHWLNTLDNLSDIGASGANRPRNLYLGGQALLPDGTIAAPSYAFTSETNTGIYRPTTNTLGLSAGGSHVVWLSTAASLIKLRGDYGLAFCSGDASTTADTVLRRDAANTLAQRNGVNAQAFNLYNTYTDASNYERLTADYDAAAGNFRLRSLAAGTGQARGLYLDGAYALRLGSGGFVRWEINATGLVANNDNTYDIGASGANRPRNLYLGTGLNTPTATVDTITPRTANVTMSSGQLLLPDGSAALPSVALGSAPTLGWAKIVNNRWSFIQLGSEKIQLGGNLFLGSGVGLAWMPTAEPGGSTADLVLQRDATGVLSLRSAVTPQTFRVYNTYTDTSNGEWLEASWSAGAAYIRTTQNGTGSSRSLWFGTQGSGTLAFGTNSTDRWYVIGGGDIWAAADNAYDIGANGVNRPRNLYLAGAVSTKVKAGTPTDADFTNPVDGMIAVDSTANKIWVRIGGVWKGVGVA